MKSSFLALVAALATTAADAATFNYVQSYSEGAQLEISFEAEDHVVDGSVINFFSEISDFTGHFSGNSLVPALSFDFSGLRALVLNLDPEGAAVLGDGRFGFPEGLQVYDTTGLYQVLVGRGPLGVDCDGIGLCGSFNDTGDASTVFDSTTSQLVQAASIPPSPVPLPGSGLLLFGALALGAGATRRRT